MDSLAIVLPAHESRFDGARRDAILTAHATQLARACSSPSTRVKVFATSDMQLHELLERIAAHRPARILIEHAPLAYEHSVVPLAVASWGKAHVVPVLLLAHREYGHACDPPGTAVAKALLAAAPLFASATRVLCHESVWARVVGSAMPSVVERLELLDDWIVVEPKSVVPVAAAAPVLVLADAVPPTALERVLQALRRDGVAFRCLTVQTAEELPPAFCAASAILVPASRREGEEMLWARTAAAFGRSVVRIPRDGSHERVNRAEHSNWTAIAHCILSDEADASATSFEEHVEKPSVGI